MTMAPAWMATAPCIGLTHLYYPASSHPGRRGHQGDPYRTARRICGDCPHRIACLNHALTNNETHGMWGGLDPDQRARHTHHDGCLECGTEISESATYCGNTCKTRAYRRRGAA